MTDFYVYNRIWNVIVKIYNYGGKMTTHAVKVVAKNEKAAMEKAEVEVRRNLKDYNNGWPFAEKVEASHVFQERTD